jgi:hypothetical protein
MRNMRKGRDVHRPLRSSSGFIRLSLQSPLPTCCGSPFRVASARGLFIALNLAILQACSNQRSGQSEPLSDREVTPVSIQEVQEAHTPAWMSIPGVVGTGIGRCDGEPCIKVFVAQRTSEIDRRIPDHVEGYPVSVEVTGPFRALDPDSG